MNARRVVFRRQAVALVVALALVLGLPALFGHRGTHAALSLMLPGSGLWGPHTVWGIVLLVASAVAAALWFRWGADWLVVVCAVSAAVLSSRWGTNQAVAVGRHLGAVPMAHEFPLVVLVAGALGAARRVLVRVPGVRRGFRSANVMTRVRCAALSHSEAAAGALLDSASLRDRCRRVGVVARGRVHRDAFTRDHAGVRAARVLTGVDTSDALRVECAESLWGVACSEPGWLRLLDVVLTAIACDEPRVHEAARELLHHEFRLHRGHRPAAVWAPFGVRVGRASEWEHALAMSLAREVGLIDHDHDWAALRQRALGAAARGARTIDDELFVAASRRWLAHVDDPMAAGVLARPTLRDEWYVRAVSGSSPTG